MLITQMSLTCMAALLPSHLSAKTIIQEFKPDIVHTHASKAGAIGRKAAFSCNVPVVLHTFRGHVFHSYFGKIIKFWVTLR